MERSSLVTYQRRTAKERDEIAADRSRMTVMLRFSAAAAPREKEIEI